MQIIKREELPEQRQVRLTIAVDKDTWQASLAKCYQGVKSVCPVAGEPTRENLEQAYGPEFLYQEAVNDTYPQALVEAISQSDIQIAGTPTLSVETIGPDGYTFAAVIDLYPEVELGQYKGLSAVYPQVELSNDDTEAALDEYARANPDVQHPERAAMGDEVTLDFEGFVDGVPFEGGKGENFDLKLGSGQFVPGFEEQVVGMTAGEEKDIDITFPEDYHKELAGKAVVFHVKLNKVTVTMVPEMDDEFAKDVSEFDTLDALKADVRAKALEQAQKQADSAFENACVEKAAENTTVDMPKALVENELDVQMERFGYQLQMSGYSMEQYAKMMGGDVNTMRNAFRPAAEKQAKISVTLEAIAKAEGLTATEEEIEEEIKSLAKQYEMEEAKVKEMVPAEELTGSLVTRKAIKLIVDSAVAVAPKAEEKTEG